MLFIPGTVMALLTFPGVIVHEWAHKIAAEWRGLHVDEVVYFQLDDPHGYVKHETPRSYLDAFAVTLAPLAVNTSMAVFIYLLIPWEGPPAVVMSVFATMIAMHALPSAGDGETLYRHARATKTPLAILTLPVVAILYILDLLKFLWIDLFFAVGVIVASGVLKYYLLQAI